MSAPPPSSRHPSGMLRPRVAPRAPCRVCRRVLGLTRGGRIPPHMRLGTGSRCPGSREIPDPATVGHPTASDARW